MQPYLLPYPGYWQLIRNVDNFVVYDNIEYTKKGWVNRNRYLLNGAAETFSLPLAKDSDYRHVRERQVADSFDPEKMLRQFAGAYSKAPRLASVLPLLEEVFCQAERNLFAFLLHSIRRVCIELGIGADLVVSSSIGADHSLRGERRVLDICQTLGAKTYVNPIGGVELYDKTNFRAQGVELLFMRSGVLEYKQFGNPFVPSLSIIDAMMFLAPETITSHLDEKFEYC